MEINGGNTYKPLAKDWHKIRTPGVKSVMAMMMMVLMVVVMMVLMVRRRKYI